MLKLGAFCMSVLIGYTSHAAAGPLQISASHGVIADFAQQIGGENVVVTMPVPAGTNPAEWMPRIADIAAIQEADLILLNGAGYEAWLDRVSLPRAKTIQTVRTGDIDLIRLLGVAHSHGTGPAHTHEGVAAQVWMDFGAAALQADAIAAALSKSAPNNAASFADSLERLRADLEALDAEAKAMGASYAGQSFLVAQPGLEYFARAYGLDLVEIAIDPKIDPTPAQWSAIDAALAETQARVILWQTSPPPATEAALAARGLVTAVFDTGANSASDTTFTALMRQNLITLQNALKR